MLQYTTLPQKHNPNSLDHSTISQCTNNLHTATSTSRCRGAQRRRASSSFRQHIFSLHSLPLPFSLTPANTQRR